MQYYIWTLENPGKTTAILIAAAIAAAIAAIAYMLYRKKHPATLKIVYDYRKPEKKQATSIIARAVSFFRGRRRKTRPTTTNVGHAGCGQAGCHCTVPCTNCTCHPATSKSKDDMKPDEGKCPFHRFF